MERNYVKAFPFTTFEEEPEFYKQMPREEEFGCPRTARRMPFHGMRRDECELPEENRRKWFTVVNMEDICPEQTVAKLDRERHVLVIKAEPTNVPYGRKCGLKNVTKRTIRLPEDICLRKLKVQYTPRGELVVKAPYCNEICEEECDVDQRRPFHMKNTIPIDYKFFTKFDDEECCDFHRRRPFFMKNTMPRDYKFFTKFDDEECDVDQRRPFHLKNTIPVDYKFFTKFDDEECDFHRRRPFYMKNTMPRDYKFFTKFDDEECDVDQRRPFHLKNTIPIDYKFFTKFDDEEEEEYNTKYFTEFFAPKKWRHMQDTMQTPTLHGCKIIRDPSTGMKMVQFEVNTIGFHKKEIFVNFDKEERLLVVEAKHEVESDAEYEEEFTPKMPITPTYLRREFFLPEGVILKKTITRLTKKGTLLIQVPILHHRQPEHGYRRMRLDHQMPYTQFAKRRYFL